LAQSIFEPNLFPYKFPNISQTKSFFTPICLWRWNRQSVPKRRHIKFRSRGITKKKAYKIHKPDCWIPWTAPAWGTTREDVSLF